MSHSLYQVSNGSCCRLDTSESKKQALPSHDLSHSSPVVQEARAAKRPKGKQEAFQPPASAWALLGDSIKVTDTQAASHALLPPGMMQCCCNKTVLSESLHQHGHYFKIAARAHMHMLHHLGLLPSGMVQCCCKHCSARNLLAAGHHFHGLRRTQYTTWDSWSHQTCVMHS